MLDHLIMRSLYALKVAFAAAPWLISMYLLFWFGKYEVWVPETPHRDKITIAILVAGMGMSFLLQSYIAKREKK